MVPFILYEFYPVIILLTAALDMNYAWLPLLTCMCVLAQLSPVKFSKMPSLGLIF